MNSARDDWREGYQPVRLLASLNPGIPHACDRPLDVPARQLAVCGGFEQRRRRLHDAGDRITNIITAGGLGHEFVELFACFHIAR